MKKHALVALASVLVLGGCGDSEVAETVEEAPAVDLAAGTGPYLVTYADGTQQLAFASPDGIEYVSAAEGPEPATYTVTDGQLCVDPPGDNEDGTPNDMCLTMGEVASDGSWDVTTGQEGQVPARMQRLDKIAVGPADQTQAGSYLVDVPEEGQMLVVWTADGKSYLGRDVRTGSWRAVDGQRCGQLDGDPAETCGTPTSELGADGTFTADDGANGAITVKML